MAGHMGVDTVTVQNLVIVDVDAENKKLYVLGLVPGNKKSLLIITKTGEQKKFVRLLSAKQKDEKEAERLAKEQEEAAKAQAAAEPAKSEEAPVAEEVVTADETVSTAEESVADASETVKEEGEEK
jgi:uncharacterized DUF497 family protein